jgi:hypothetical protein
MLLVIAVGHIQYIWVKTDILEGPMFCNALSGLVFILLLHLLYFSATHTFLSHLEVYVVAAAACTPAVKHWIAQNNMLIVTWLCTYVKLYTYIFEYVMQE